MEQLSGQDASFVYLETPTTPMHIGSLGIYDPSTAPGGKVRFKEILSFVESRLAGARSFRQRLVRVPFDLDHPYWIEDPDFDIEYHIRHLALPAPGDWRQLCILVARLHSRPLDMTKPLWEFTVIEGLDNIEGLPKGCFALLSKVHHAAIDGMSGVEMSAAVHDLEPGRPAREFKDDWQPGTVPPDAELLVRAHMNNLTRPMQAVELLTRGVPALSRALKGLVSKDLKLPTTGLAPNTRLNGTVSPHRVFDGVPFPLDDIRAIKDAVEGATVNDVILSIVGGGLRRYLSATGELPEKSLLAMAPISVRDKNEKSALGNLVSAMVVKLGTHIDDPLKRLKYVHKKSSESKALTNAVGARTLTEFSKLMPAGLSGLSARLYTRLGIANAHAPAFNCVVTNVPGSPVPLYFAGARMLRMMGTGPVFDTMALINTIYSYAGTIAISFTSDRKSMPDPAAYADALRETFEELKAATVGKRSKPAPKANPAAQPAAKQAAKPKAAARKTAAAKKTAAKPKAAVKSAASKPRASKPRPTARRRPSQPAG